jgi:Myristoyl-CoA:protein N-myristoyltransferase, C-terminal domain
MENKEFLKELKFGKGDGNLQYYVYNWRCPSILPHKVKFTEYIQKNVFHAFNFQIGLVLQWAFFSHSNESKLWFQFPHQFKSTFVHHSFSPSFLLKKYVWMGRKYH